MYSICFIILLFFVLVFPNNTKEGYGKFFLPFSFILLFFFSTFLFHGWNSDYGRYYIHVLECYDIPLQTLMLQNAFLEILLYKFVAVVFHDPIFFFVIVNSVILASYYLFIRKFVYNEKLFVMAFFCIYGYFQMSNTVMQLLACSIILFGVFFLLEQKNIKCLIFLALAYFIHNSAFIFLLLLLLAKIDFTKKMMVWYAVLIVAAVPVTVYLLPYVQLFYYSDWGDGCYGFTEANSFNISKIIPVAISVFFLIKMMSKQSLSALFNNNKILMNLSLHGAILYIFFIVVACNFALLFARVSYYFIPFALLTVDRGLLLLYKEKNLKFICHVCLYSYFCLWFIAMQSVKENSSDVRFIWQIEDRPIVENIDFDLIQENLSTQQRYN